MKNREKFSKIEGRACGQSLKSLLPLFQSKGQLVDTSTAPRFSLQNDTIWLLEMGSVDVFAIEEKNKGIEKSYFLVTEFNTPSLLFNLPANKELSFLLATRSSSKLWSLPKKIFEEWASDEKNFSALSSALSDWVYHFSAVLKDQDLVPTAYLSFEALSLKENDLIALKIAPRPEDKEHIQWIELIEGRLAFPRFPEIRLAQKQIFPLSPHVILRAADDHCKVQVVPEQRLYKKWKEALELFHICLSKYLLAYIKQNQKEQKKQIALKREKEKESLDDALYQVSIIFEPEAPFQTAAGDALFKACQIVGKSEGISFLPLMETAFSDLDTELKAICRISSVRYRRVTLVPTWWKGDCGPLLGFYGPERVPVALIRKRNSYLRIDPSKRESIKVNASIAKELAGMAYLFYPPLPSDAARGWKLALQYIQKNRAEALAVLYTGIFFGLILLFPPTATKVLFARIIPSESIPWLMQVFIGLVIAAFATAIFFGVRSLSVLRMEAKISDQVQGGLWDHLLGLPVHFFRGFSIGDLINRVTAVEQIRKLLSGNSIQIILSGIFSVFYLLVMYVYSPFLSFCALSFLVIGLLITAVCFYRKAVLMKKMLEIGGTINGTLIQIISGIGKVRVAGAEIRAFSHWAQQFSSFTKLHLKSQSIQNFAIVVNSFLPALMTMMVFTGYMFFIQTNSFLVPRKMDIGTFLGFYTAFALFSTVMLNVSTTLFPLAPIYHLWQRARMILEASPEKVTKQLKPENLTGSFAIDQVSFRYQPQGAPILSEVSIQGNPGEFIGIVGPSGCGKSTLINLLLSFENPEKGIVYFNNKNLNTLDIREVRRQIGTVLQNDSLLSGSIYDNIVCGRVSSKEEIDKVIKLSGFADDLADFPMGIHTFLSVAGESLSGGQKQKLLIARALLGNPKILIFDEATSALDNTSQDAISRNIATLNMTRIVVAHRLSTIRNADRIYVIDKGKVIQTGTFSQLETAPGLFADMLAKQKL